MSSRSYPIEKSMKNGLTLPLNKRLLLIFIACCIQTTYLPTSFRTTGGIEPKLPIDIFPVWPIWVVPYVLCYLLWFSCMLWIVFKTEDRAFLSFSAACMLTFAIGATTFVFFPTYVKSVPFGGNDIFTAILRMIHEGLGRYSAFPSGHVYITTLLALFFRRWYPRQKFLWMLILLIVSLSTLFTGQHYILDVLGGYGAALAGYHFGLWWAGFYSARNRPGKRPGKRMASSSFH